MDSFRYIDVIRNHLIASRDARYKKDEKWYFQHDNATPHTAKRSLQAFEDGEIEAINWPANSPDLNPIENIWSIIDKQLINCDIKTTDE